MRIAARLEAVVNGGATTVDQDGLHVHGATEAWLLILGSATSFTRFDESPAANGLLGSRRAGWWHRDTCARQEPWTALQDRAHPRNTAPWIDRVDLQLVCEPGRHRRRSADRPAHRGSRREGPALVALLFQYGRYL